MPPEAPPQFDELEGQVVMRGASVRVLETLPTAKQLDGVGTFGTNWLDIKIERGLVDTVAVTGGVVRLSPPELEGSLPCRGGAVVFLWMLRRPAISEARRTGHD